MSRHTLLDLLGTDKLPKQAEEEFTAFCFWKQAHPAIVQVLESAGLDDLAQEAKTATTLETLSECISQAVETAREADLAVMAFAAVQGLATDADQLFVAASSNDPAAVSFHSARLVGWATWAANRYQTGTFKATAEGVAYGEQLQALMTLLGVKGI